MNKPERPAPPEGYRWVAKGEIVWPSDVFQGVTTLVPCAAKFEWRPCTAEFHFLRPKVTQPDLAWLKSKALEQANRHPVGSVERERILWAVTEAVRSYSDALRALVPEREQWRPKQEGGEA